jgi:hypothetical protein
MKLTVEKIKLSELKKRFGNIDISVLVPKYNRSIEVYKTLPLNQTLQADIKSVRNIDHHCKYFAILQEFTDQCGIDRIIDDNIGVESLLRMDKNGLLNFLKWMFLPHEYLNTPKGLVEIWSSISFEKMDQIEFTKFYNDCVNYMASVLGCDRVDLELYGSDNL